MNFPFFIAKRYFFTKKRNNFTHIISWVSLLAVTIGTAALILVLSVFNGFEDLILKMYSSFDPHLEIKATEGAVFNPQKIESFLKNSEFESIAYVLEEKVLLKYQEKEFIATIKGVSKGYHALTKFDSLLVDGQYINSYENNNVGVIGSGIAYHMSISLDNMFDQVKVFVLNRKAKTLFNPHNAFKTASILPVGIFSIQAEIDQEYIITPLNFLQTLADRQNNISAIEINLIDEAGMLEAQERLEIKLGDNFVVKNRFEQQDFLYKILGAEKLAVYFILTFIMIIAAFNIIGSLSMLMLDKKKDIKTFKSLGCTQQDIQTIFFRKSMLTVVSGLGLGLLLGLGLAFLQHLFGFIKMGDGGFVINNYPIEIVFSDLIIITLTVFVIGVLASWYPARVLSIKLFRI